MRDIVPQVREAFRQAQMGTPGPVLVEFPLDVLYPYSMVQKEVVGMSAARSLKGKIINFYLNTYMKNMFAAAFDVERDTKPWPVEIPFPKNPQLQKTYDLLAKSKRPLILLGSQSVLPPVGAEKLAELLRKLNVPCYLGGMSRGLLGAKCDLHMRQARREALKEADLIILAGAVADFRLNYGRVLPKEAKIISINRSKEQMVKNSDMFWTPTLTVQSDVGQFMLEFMQLVEKKGPLPNWGDWIAQLRKRDEAKEASNEEMALQKTDEKFLNPVKLLQQVDQVLTDKTILIADGGDFVATAAYVVRPRRPLSWLDPGAYGTLGVGAGFALGAKLARPDADVVVLFGDGSLGYSLMEFDTFVRHKVNVTAIVGNDACWTQIAREQVPILGSSVACDLTYNNYEGAVSALGANGLRLDGSSADKVKETINQAIAATRGENGKPVLVNCLIGKTDFRKGSLSV